MNRRRYKLSVLDVSSDGLPPGIGPDHVSRAVGQLFVDALDAHAADERSQAPAVLDQIVPLRVADRDLIVLVWYSEFAGFDDQGDEVPL